MATYNISIGVTLQVHDFESIKVQVGKGDTGTSIKGDAQDFADTYEELETRLIEIVEKQAQVFPLLREMVNSGV